jgi:pimeloyl-ACP methyl ester carboxylesterase
MRGMMRNLPKLEHVMVPVLVLGDQRDGTVSIEELHSTARAYRTTAEVFPNMGHDMMLEPGWATVCRTNPQLAHRQWLMAPKRRTRRGSSTRAPSH